jgi:hypothetical protein
MRIVEIIARMKGMQELMMWGYIMPAAHTEVGLQLLLDHDPKVSMGRLFSPIIQMVVNDKL